MKMISVAYVPGLSWNLLSTRRAVEQWGKLLVYYKIKAVSVFPGEESFVFNFFPRKGLVSATKCKTDPESRGSVGVGSKNG